MRAALQENEPDPPLSLNTDFNFTNRQNWISLKQSARPSPPVRLGKKTETPCMRLADRDAVPIDSRIEAKRLSESLMVS